MSSFSQRITKTCKEIGKYATYTGKGGGGRENHPTENVPEGAKSILNMLKELKKSISKELKEITTTLCHKIENINKMTEMKRIK